MRIIVIGGISRSLINFRGPLLKTMMESGHEVIACAPDASDDIRAKLAGMGVRYRHVAIARSGVNPLADLKTLFSLFLLFRSERPDIILAYTVKPVIWGCLRCGSSGRHRH